MKRIDIQKKQWAFAVEILKKHGYAPKSDHMTLSGDRGHYHIIMHVDGFVNCLCIGCTMTEADIERYIEQQVNISKYHKFP